jgi:FkbM family methyltransferase
MSRTAAAALAGVVDVVSRLQGRRQRGKTVANLMNLLEERGLRSVSTQHGDLRFLTMRGRHVAGAVDNFFGNEPETLAWIDTLPPGDTLWDIGAAHGQFALYAGARGLNVVALEPKATSYGVLVEHVALNGLGERVTPLCLALSDQTGRTALHLMGMDAGGAMNALAGSTTPLGEVPPGFRQPVFAARMDEALALYDLPRPDHLKLDVDGLEAPILEAGAECLRTVRSVLVEVEGRELEATAERIARPLVAAGLHEDVAYRTRGTGRNRLFQRA